MPNWGHTPMHPLAQNEFECSSTASKSLQSECSQKGNWLQVFQQHFTIFAEKSLQKPETVNWSL